MLPAAATTIRERTVTLNSVPIDEPAARATPRTPFTRPRSCSTRVTRQLGTIVVLPARCASARNVSAVPCLPPCRQPKTHHPHWVGSHPLALRGSCVHRQPNDVHPRRSASLLPLIVLTAVPTLIRSQTASIARASRSSAKSESPAADAHSCRIGSGSRSDVCQLTVVPPPTHAPARIATPRSRDDVVAWSR